MKTKNKQPYLIPTEGFAFDADSHSYYFDGKPMTGVTTVLGVISKPALIPWAAKMATEYIREHVEYVIPGEDGGFWAIKPSTVEEARKAHSRKKDDAATKGTDLHALVEEYVGICMEENQGRTIALGALDPKFTPIEKFARWATDENIRFRATEKKVYSKILWCAGTLDLVFEKQGKVYLGDIKTYAKLWDRTPMLQMGGYGFMWEEMGNPAVEGYCVLRLGKDGSFEEKWSYDVKGDREGFLAAVRLYRCLQNW